MIRRHATPPSGQPPAICCGGGAERGGKAAFYSLPNKRANKARSQQQQQQSGSVQLAGSVVLVIGLATARLASERWPDSLSESESRDLSPPPAQGGGNAAR